MKSLSYQIKQKAIELGFHKIGFAKVESLDDDERKYNDWLYHNYQGTMRWLENNSTERMDPGKNFKGAKSIISVAMNYYKIVPQHNDDSVANISRYALGGDYHVALKTRLHSLLKYIKGIEAYAEGKVFVDSGSLLEKAWAAGAGIGWRGKHSIIVTKEFGSWVFLGEILLNLDLEYDKPISNQCGDCRKCIDACPTQAILKPYVLDASRCIAYLTIEHDGEVEKSLAEKIDHQIFGCDICQEVCPWNKKNAKPTDVKEFFLNEDYRSLKLKRLEGLKQSEFNRLFGNSPIKRSGLKILKRNVRVVMNNIEKKERI